MPFGLSVYVQKIGLVKRTAERDLSCEKLVMSKFNVVRRFPASNDDDDMVQLVTIKCTALACVVQHGESEMNDCGRIGGDSDLSAHGQEVCFCHLVVGGNNRV